jgi:broad specificity phosphatase PhoE
MTARARRLILVRHCETAWSLEERVQGLRDIPLTPLGLRQAERVAGRLRGERIDVIMTSTLSRAIDTAQIIRNSVDLLKDKEILTFAELNERDYGDFTGRTKEELSAGGLLPRWHLLRYLIPPPGGESVMRQSKKVRKFIREAFLRYPDENILIVTHAGTLKILVAYFLNKGLKWTMRFRPSSGGITILSGDGKDWEAELLNDVSHLHELSP